MIFTTAHEDTYGFKSPNGQYFISSDLKDLKKFLEEYANETYIVFSRGGYDLLNGKRVINLAIDCSDTLDLQIWMAHTYHKISYEIQDELDAIENMYRARLDYYNAKKELGAKFNLDGEVLTNAQLVSRILGLKTSYDKKKDFVYKAPFEIDESDPLVQYFMSGDKNNYELEIAGCPCSFSRGGVHGSLLSYSSKSADDKVILYYDITSYYPSILKYFNYLQDNKVFNDMYDEHIKNKTPATKLLLNTISGVLELYQPNTALSMRITGQLLIYQALKELEKECKSFKLINLNTDGFVCEISTKEQKKLDLKLKSAKICQISTLKCQKVEIIFIKDVNDLVMKFEDGTTKVAGFLNYGINTKGRFSINNNALIIKTAVINKLLNDIDEEKTINDSRSNTTLFQYVASASDKYKCCYYGNKQLPLVNRVYASKDVQDPTVYKSGTALSKIQDIPEHCTMDAKNIDLGFYIAKAKKTIKEYGYKEENKPMPEQNVYQKLLKARVEFQKSGISKNGINKALEFHYFTLDDIIPVVNKVFDEVGLLGITSFTDDLATLTIYNVANPNETIVFTSPMRELDTIIGRTGSPVSNKIQLLGSVETYERRYLYLVALDIIESDTVDSNLGNEPKTPSAPLPPEVKGFVPNPQQREKATQTVVGAEQQATQLQKDGLKRVMEKAVSVKPELTTTANKLLAETNNLANITKERAEKYVVWFSEQIDGGNENGMEK